MATKKIAEEITKPKSEQSAKRGSELPAKELSELAAGGSSDLAAKRYLMEQARIMQKYGEQPKLSGKRYDNALRSVTQTFETIESAR